MSAWAVIAAAGSGSRMVSGAAGLLPERSKVLLPLADGISSLERSLLAFAKANCITGVVLAIRESERQEITDIVARVLPGTETVVVPGGEHRQESVYKALLAIPEERAVDVVLIHDAARPLVSPELILAVLEETRKSKACIPVLPVKATLKKIGEAAGDEQQNAITETIPRVNICEAQTPQGFDLAVILAAHKKAAANGFLATDDSELVECLGNTVTVVKGSEENLKLTTPSDLLYLEWLLRKSNE